MALRMYSRPVPSARRCAITGSPFVTYRSIKRVPRRIVAFTIPERAPASAFSIGVKVIPSTALGCVRAPLEGAGETFSLGASPPAAPRRLQGRENPMSWELKHGAGSTEHGARSGEQGEKPVAAAVSAAKKHTTRVPPQELGCRDG